MNTSGWIEGSNTEIRVEFDDDAWAEAEGWSGPGEKIVEKCFWRLVWERWDEVSGESVRFRVSRSDLLGLVERLQAANNEIVN
ncbi:MAG TPA: hypothetical protein VGS02_03895 [Acidobacteriaceae bacterium]|nr:hypothetical protein [Acidobacteriaceae bacterium]